MRDPLAAVRRLAAGGLMAAAGCSGERSGPSPGGFLEVEWVGGDTGRLVAPAVGEWCDSLRILEVRAVHGDTGIALALYPADSVEAGEYPLVVPQRADSVRPASAAALRWFAETSIRGFRSDSGTVRITGVTPGAGRFSGTLRSVTEGTRLTVTGSFQGITVGPAPADCAGVAPDPDDTEPDLEEEFEETSD